MSRPVLASLALAIFFAANVQGTREALSLAAESGNISMVRQLIEEGVDVNHKEGDGYGYGGTALLFAAKNDQLEVVKLLIEAGGDVNVAAPEYYISKSEWKTPLIHAVWRKDLDMVNLLIAAGADVNYQNDKGDTALLLAVKWDNLNNLDIIQALIRAPSADVNVKYPDTMRWPYAGRTPLMLAIMGEKKEICELLINAGSDLSYRDPEGYNALLLTTSQPPFADEAFLTEIVKLLIAAGADVNVSAEWFGVAFTPLMHAAREKREEMCKILIEAGADTCNISLGNGLNKIWEKRQRDIIQLVTKLKQEGNNGNDACCSGAGGIKCCPEYSTGDNDGKGGEHFVQEEEYRTEKGCKGTCLDLYPDTRGITESLTQKYANKKHNKCWCEMGDPILKENAGYKTCILK